MTKFSGVDEYGDTEKFSHTRDGLNIGQASHSFSNRKKYFCLPSFAASSIVRETMCALNVQTFSEWQDQFPQSPIQKKAKNRKKRGRGNPTYAGISYGSVSEAALGILLEQLIPGFSVKEGKTFQLPLGQGRTVDFLIDNTLVEFHFPRSFSRGNDLGDFKDYKERRDFLRALKRVGRNRHQRKKLLRATHEKLIQNYTFKRRRQIDMSVYGPHTELIVASTAEEFYWSVICRFVGVQAISEQAFVDKFNQCCRSVINSSREALKEAA